MEAYERRLIVDGPRSGRTGTSVARPPSSAAFPPPSTRRCGGWGAGVRPRMPASGVAEGSLRQTSRQRRGEGSRRSGTPDVESAYGARNGGGGGLATFHSWVGGREVEGRGGLRAATNPATGEAFGQASLLDAAQAGEAIAAAHAAFPAWSRTSFAERARLLDRWRQAIVDEADDDRPPRRARAGQARRRGARRRGAAVARGAQAPRPPTPRSCCATRRSRRASCCWRTSRRGSCTRLSGWCWRSSPGTTPGASRCRCWRRRSSRATRWC